MRRTLVGALLGLALVACSANVAQTPAPTVSPTPTPTPTPAPTPEPSKSPPDTPAPAPTEPAADEHPAAGLTLVQFPDPNSPASQIFVVEADGSLRQLTGVSGDMGATRPAWSPDGTVLAFEGPKTGGEIGGQIGIVNADGSDERQIAVGAGIQWSPDGTRLLFNEVDDVTSEPVTLYVIDVASGEVTDLGQGFGGRWLPDGEQIVFHRIIEVEGGGFTDALFAMSLDSGETEQLAVETEAVWAPDGSAALLVNEGVIHLADSDGSSPRELVDGFAPAWSPDGTRIAFAYDFNQDALPILAVVDREGTELWSGVVGATPAWSADGTRIAVEIEYPEQRVQVIDAESGDVLYEIEGTDPAWMP